MIIDCKKIAEEIKAEVKFETEKLFVEKKIKPGLVVILVGENPASKVYVSNKQKSCIEAGFYSVTEKLSADVSEAELLSVISKFNNDKNIHGILVQLPLPNHINEQKIIEAINPKKDVDGFHPENLGKLVIGIDTFIPCTPAGIIELLLRSKIDCSGKHVVVVGRSNIVGKPIANILSQKKDGLNAIVTIVHTGAKDLSVYTLQADILIAAIGKPKIITKEMVKPGAVVIDVGINRVEDLSFEKGYKIVGDVDFFEVEKISSAITPVPGGVGLLTIAMLLKNCLVAAKKFS